jgi:hypothetical protein
MCASSGTGSESLEAVQACQRLCCARSALEGGELLAIGRTHRLHDERRRLGQRSNRASSSLSLSLQVLVRLQLCG